MAHFEKQLSSSLMLKGKIIDVYHDTVELENGRTSLREVVRHKGAVGALAQKGKNLVFVKQYRYAIGNELFEICAGKLEYGEQPESAMRRELLEETGCRCEKLFLLGKYHASAGILDEVIYLYFTDGLVFEGACPDEDEFLSTVETSAVDFEKMIARGEITDGKTLAAFALARAKGLI